MAKNFHFQLLSHQGKDGSPLESYSRVNDGQFIVLAPSIKPPIGVLLLRRLHCIASCLMCHLSKHIPSETASFPYRTLSCGICDIGGCNSLHLRKHCHMPPKPHNWASPGQIPSGLHVKGSLDGVHDTHNKCNPLSSTKATQTTNTVNLHLCFEPPKLIYSLYPAFSRSSRQTHIPDTD